MSCSPATLVRIVVGLFGVAACRETPPTPAPSPTLQAMHDLLGRDRFERLRSNCPYFDFLVLATAPQEILTEARGCREEVADTSYYLYIDQRGNPVVAGRTFSIHPEQVGPAFIVSRDRLRSLMDRERPHLVSRYGPSASCVLGSPYRPDDGWMERWDGENFGVLLIGSYSEAWGSVSLEVHAGEPSCNRMAGAPYDH